MKKTLLTLSLLAMFHWNVNSVLSAEEPKPKEPTLDQRVGDLEAYINNGARGTDAPSRIGGAGPGHNGWMMTSSALVLFMTLPGLALFYGGLVRRKNVLSVLAQCLGIAGLVTISGGCAATASPFTVAGPSAAGHSSAPWTGSFEGRRRRAEHRLRRVGLAQRLRDAQLMFAIITPR